MAESSMPWDGLTVGDATVSPYDAATEFAQLMRAVGYTSWLADLGGVFWDVGNELAPTCAGAVSPVTIDTGEAMCHGTFYGNTAAISIPVSTPALLTRYDRIVIRKSWAAQTVRVAHVINPVEGNPPVALVQVAGTTWEIPIAVVAITVGGAITITDSRVRIPCWMTDHIFNDAIDDTKVGNRVAQFYRRQGGHADNWSVAGTNNYIPTLIRTQEGSFQMDLAPGGDVITFPVPFTWKPIVKVSCSNSTGAGEMCVANIMSVNNNNFSVKATNLAGATADPIIYWTATGPE